MITLMQPHYPSGIEGNGIDAAYPDFEDDLISCLSKSGNEEKFSAKLNQRLHYLCKQGKNCILKSDWFERLKHDNENVLYSLKIKDKKNIRIIFIFYNNSPLFLSAFQENGRNTAKDYRIAMEKAHARLNNLIEAGLIKEEDILCHSQ